ncbi:MAG: InlB B-repeat-containing protein, partial [Bacilli bacterium]|nr:InlB B-repeat-containing protein [Bacilli bacterium]
VKYNSGSSYTLDRDLILYAIYGYQNYTITYNLNGGKLATGVTNPTSYNVGTATFTLNNPSKTVKITGKDNGTGATIGAATSKAQTFKGWTGANGTTAQTTVTQTKGSKTGNLTYTANWTPVAVNVPTLKKDGYDCKWNTKANGTGTNYTTTSTYTPTANSGESIDLFAICTPINYEIQYDLQGGQLGEYCTGENGTCTFEGTKEVCYGAEDTYTCKTATNSIVCSNTIFGGDPFPGVAKSCYISNTNPSSYNIESSDITLNNPLKTGYTFTGWTGSNGETPSTLVTIPTGSTGAKGYIANYTARTYTLNFNPNGGTYNNTTSPTAKTMTFGTTNNNDVGIATRGGYTFDGWGTSTCNVKYYDNTGKNTAYKTHWTAAYPNGTWRYPGTGFTMYACWVPKTYAITLNKNGATNTPTANITATYDSATLNPASITLPTRSYTVSGFGLDASRKSNGATVSSTSALTSTYTFDGWTTEQNSGSLLLSKDATPVLQSNVSGYTNASGNWTRDNTATAYAKWLTTSGTTSATVKLPKIEKTGYTCGWTESSTGTTITYASEESITPTANKTLYGVCTANTYTVTANSNGGSIASTTGWSGTGNTATKSVTYDNAYGTLPTVSRTSYTFKGWSLLPEGYTQVEYIESTGIQYINTG